MDVRNCRQCGRLYNYVGGAYRNLCPNCIKYVEDKFAEVKGYIEENKTATINMVATECEVSTKQIEQWIREERLCFSEDSAVGIACEVCGKTIKTGRYCDLCKNTVVNQLSNLYKPTVVFNEKKKDANARMRFLDKE